MSASIHHAQCLDYPVRRDAENGDRNINAQQPGIPVRLGSEDENKATATAKAHALIISGVELALSLTNAVDNNAFRRRSSTNGVFFSSAVVEAAGFTCALFWARRGYGAGSPLMMVWEAAATGSVDRLAQAVLGGFGFQGIVLICTGVALFFIDAVKGVERDEALAFDSSWEYVGIGILFFFFVGASLYILRTAYNRYFDNGTTQTTRVPCCRFELLPDVLSEVVDMLSTIRRAFVRGFGWLLISYCILFPIAIEVSESAVIFSGGSTSSAAYALATLDLVLVVPALWSFKSFLPRVISLLRNDGNRE
ncbi:unnamed protein product [Scytosiphon promiscuus]